MPGLRLRPIREVRRCCTRSTLTATAPELLGRLETQYLAQVYGQARMAGLYVFFNGVVKVITPVLELTPVICTYSKKAGLGGNPYPIRSNPVISAQFPTLNLELSLRFCSEPIAAPATIVATHELC